MRAKKTKRSLLTNLKKILKRDPKKVSLFMDEYEFASEEEAAEAQEKLDKLSFDLTSSFDLLETFFSKSSIDKEVDKIPLDTGTGAITSTSQISVSAYDEIMNQIKANLDKPLIYGQGAMVYKQAPKSDHIQATTTSKIELATGNTGNISWYDWASTNPQPITVSSNHYTCKVCAANVDVFEAAKHNKYHEEYEELKTDFSNLLDMLSSYFDAEDSNEGHDDLITAEDGGGGF